ncbi:MAG TPA: iron-sulfur cluster assembly accessory protein [Patescibacteria group bacterium]|jgi:iron-sulfur cluster assembly protein|nr:iron-sulfur cluster assembly accessory protein [Patescibacteria group bacterium]
MMIEITPKATAQVLKLMKDQGLEGAALRLSVKPSGCSGLEYVMDFDRQTRDGDQILDTGGLKVLMDGNSAAYLQDIRLDWGDGLLGSGFKFSNPNASKTCGCGKSFSV